MEGKKPLILVVDDDSDIRALLAHELAKAGYAIVEAADAASARECIDAGLPDLVISDIHMPGVSGIDFVAGLREVPALSRIPVIYLTGLEEDTELAVKTVGYPLLSKPVKLPELLREVRAQLQRRA